MPEGSARDLTATWPLVGRDEQLALIDDVLLGSTARAVVLGGVAGVGKSRLLAEAEARASSRDAIVARVRASQSASSIPFGALAPLLPYDELLADSVVGVLQRAAKAIAALGDGKLVVLAVDDAHLLDDASATLVHQLALDGSVRLLLAIRRGEPLSASMAGVVTDPSTFTLDLQQLTKRDVAAVTEHVLDADVDGPVRQALWEGSQGNALYLRELLVASVEDGSITLEEGVWRLRERPTVPARLVELIESRLAAVTDDERVALELLSINGAIGRSALEDVAGTDAVSQLVRRGLVVAAREGRRQPVCLHHSLYEEALRRRMSSRRLRATQRRLAEMIVASGMRRRDDRMLVTTLMLDAGGDLDAEILEAAALDAYFALDVELTERLIRASIAAGAGTRMRRLLAETLRRQGRHEEAEAIIVGISVVDLDERERALLALVRAENLFHGLGDHESAVEVLRDAKRTIRDEDWRLELVAMEAGFTAFSGDVRTALPLAESVIELGPSRALRVASTAASAALTVSGRPDDAVSVAAEAFRVASVLAPQENQAVLANHIVEQVFGLIEAGSLLEAERMARMSYEWSLAGRQLVGQGWFALLLGRSAQTGGRLEEAVRRFRESALVFRDVRDHAIRRWALAGLAQTSATLGRSADASMALEELDTAPRVAVHLLEAEVTRARAWLAVSRRAMGDARRLLLDAADWAAERGQHGLELIVLHDLVRLGDVRSAAARAAALAPTLQGQLNAARGAHARAAREQDGRLLDGAADAFAEIGANLFAAEAAAQAAAAHRRAGLLSSTTASERRSTDLQSRCEGASTPALAHDTEADLTPRELEIATRAASGSSSAEIAASLGISVRTVDNLLQRAYVKLGVSGRRQLAARLEHS